MMVSPVMDRPTKVWPLVQGLKGFNATGNPIDLQPGMHGWMDYDDAVVAEKKGYADIMAGKTPQSLRAPSYDTKVVEAADPAPVGEDDANRVLDEEDEAPVKPPPSRRKTNPKRRQYQRRDMKAEA